MACLPIIGPPLELQLPLPNSLPIGEQKPDKLLQSITKESIDLINECNGKYLS